MNKRTYQQKKDAWTKKCLTAKALTQPRETLPIGDYTRVIFLDHLFKVKITDCIQREELIETLKTFQKN